MCRRMQGGFTLAEVLASVFLLALGLVCAAGMQVQALRTAQQSAFRTAALSLTTEMADMMRMTLSAPNQQALLMPYLQTDFAPGRPAQPSIANCYYFSCSAEQFVAFTIEQWRQRMEASLPDAKAKICLDSRPGEGGAAQLDWTCRTAASIAEQGKGALVIKIGWRDKTLSAEPAKPSGNAQDTAPLLVLTVAPLAP